MGDTCYDRKGGIVVPVLKEIHIKTEDGRIPASQCRLIKGRGIAEDTKAAGGERQVAFSDVDAGRDGGLCGARYQANLVIEGLDFSALQVGTHLRVGEAVLLIRILGKRCFPECPLVQEGRTPCYLNAHCGFLSVEEEGTCHVGDEVFVMDGGLPW